MYTHSVFTPPPLGTGQNITTVGGASAKDVDAAVKAADEAFKTTWGMRTPGYERGRLLNKLADLMEQNIDELAAIEALNGGTSSCCYHHQ